MQSIFTRILTLSDRSMYSPPAFIPLSEHEITFLSVFLHLRCFLKLSQITRSPLGGRQKKAKSMTNHSSLQAYGVSRGTQSKKSRFCFEHDLIQLVASKLRWRSRHLDRNVGNVHSPSTKWVSTMDTTDHSIQSNIHIPSVEICKSYVRFVRYFVCLMTVCSYPAFPLSKCARRSSLLSVFWL